MGTTPGTLQSRESWFEVDLRLKNLPGRQHEYLFLANYLVRNNKVQMCVRICE